MSTHIPIISGTQPSVILANNSKVIATTTSHNKWLAVSKNNNTIGSVASVASYGRHSLSEHFSPYSPYHYYNDEDDDMLLREGETLKSPASSLEDNKNVNLEPTLNILHKRVLYNPVHNTLLANFSRLHVRTKEHVENIRHVLLKKILKAQTENNVSDVNMLVNYDDFLIESEDLMKYYTERVLHFFTEQKYYRSIQRYTTKTFLHDTVQKLDYFMNEYKIIGPIRPGVEVIKKRYVVNEIIGEGAFGRVKLATDNKRLERVAIKELDLNVFTLNPELKNCLEREEKVIKQIMNSSDKHRNIVHFYDYIHDEPQKCVHIVMEYCENGSLETNFDEHEQFEEELAHRYFVQIIEGVEFLQMKHHIVHRDLQLQNICRTRGNVIKICDFGVSDFFVPGEKTLDLFCGNYAYASPEMGKRPPEKYGCEVDIWSCGVCLYKIIVGYLPFRNRGHSLIGQFAIPLDDEELSHISDECKDLITKMLNPDFNERISTVKQVKNHPWWNKYHTK